MYTPWNFKSSMLQFMLGSGKRMASTVKVPVPSLISRRQWTVMSLLWASVTQLSNEDVPHEAAMRNNGTDVGQTAL